MHVNTGACAPTHMKTCTHTHHTHTGTLTYKKWGRRRRGGRGEESVTSAIVMRFTSNLSIWELEAGGPGGPSTCMCKDHTGKRDLAVLA